MYAPPRQPSHRLVSWVRQSLDQACWYCRCATEGQQSGPCRISLTAVLIGPCMQRCGRSAAGGLHAAMRAIRCGRFAAGGLHAAHRDARLCAAGGGMPWAAACGARLFVLLAEQHVIGQQQRALVDAQVLIHRLAVGVVLPVVVVGDLIPGRCRAERKRVRVDAREWSRDRLAKPAGRRLSGAPGLWPRGVSECERAGALTSSARRSHCACRSQASLSRIRSRHP